MILYPAPFRDLPHLLCALSTRLGGHSGAPLGMNLSFAVGDDERMVARNRQTFFGALGIREDDVVFLQQVHGTRVICPDAPVRGEPADGSVTTTPGVYLSVTIADCVPVFLADPAVPAVGALHAGWKGTAGKIVGEGVRTMTDALSASPGRLQAYIGPSAGACCYAVGEEVAALLPADCVRSENGRLFADLKAANTQALLAAGIPRTNIVVDPACTICGATLFHSHRRDGARSGRMMGVIGIRPGPTRG